MPGMRPISLCTLIVIALFLTGCAPAAAPTAPPSAPTGQPQALAPQALPTATAGNEATPAEVITPTSGPFVLDFTPPPTDTALPTLELPTEAPRAPAVQVWDGLPTYPAESNPDYYFRLRFDPDVWALTTDLYGSPALAHRTIANCIISPTAGRGLPPNATADHEEKRLGTINYQISTIYVNGIKQFVTYTAGDGRIYTAFQVSFADQADQCLQDAETVLSTLTSVAIFQATPIATP